MIVGMAPGREELANDTPFIGGSGRLLWKLLGKCGIDRADCYILNTIGEWPEGSTGDPSEEQFDRWWDEFDSAAHDFQGRVVVLLGGAALRRYTGLSGGITKWRGYIVRPDRRSRLERPHFDVGAYKTTTYKKVGEERIVSHKKGDPKVIKTKLIVEPPYGPNVETILPTIHPASVLRSGFLETPTLAADLRRVGRAREGRLLKARTHYYEVPTIRPGEPAIAFDIETSIASGQIERMGIADTAETWSCLWDDNVRAATRAILSPETGVKIAHNLGFDYPILARAGVPINGPLYDTMFACAMLQPDLLKGLNAAASYYLDRERWKHESEARPAYYNAQDASAELELYYQTKALLTETGQIGLFEGTIMGAMRSLMGMGTKGIRIDTARRDGWINELEAKGKELLADWDLQTGGCKINSPVQVKKLFRANGMELKLNKYGAESTDQESLMKLMADYPDKKPLLELLLETRGVYKDLSTYAKIRESSDGRVHPNFVPAFKDEDGLGKGLAGTWRVTAKEPNLQNQPPAARLMYVPSEGMVFVGADYSQLEARILAAASGDERLMEDCVRGIHDANAKRLGVDKTRAKNGFYGWSYLAGARTLYNTFLAKGYKVPLKECEALLEGFNRAYDKAAAFRRQIIAGVEAKRYVENPFGLRRYFPQLQVPAPAAVSTWVQSSGAIMMWRIIPQLDEALRSLGGSLLVSVHDDVLCEVPAEKKNDGLQAIKEIMEQEFNEIAPGFRAPVGLKWSPDSWGAMEAVA